MATSKKSPDATGQAKEEKIKKIVRNCDLKKFDPELDEMTHPSKPAEDD
jgi:hypothetical protein